MNRRNQVGSIRNVCGDIRNEMRIGRRDVLRRVLFLILWEHCGPIAQPRPHGLGVSRSTPLCGLSNVVSHCKLHSWPFVLKAWLEVPTGGTHLLYIAAEIFDWDFASVGSTSMVSLKTRIVIRIWNTGASPPNGWPIVSLHSWVLLRLYS